MKSLVLCAKIFGVTLFEDVTMINNFTMVNDICAGVHNNFAMLNVFYCSDHCSNGDKKDAS